MLGHGAPGHHISGEGGVALRGPAGQVALGAAHQRPHRCAPDRVRQGRALEGMVMTAETALMQTLSFGSTSLGRRGSSGLTRAW